MLQIEREEEKAEDEENNQKEFQSLQGVNGRQQNCGCAFDFVYVDINFVE
jgi:hypothetical protein